MAKSAAKGRKQKGRTRGHMRPLWLRAFRALGLVLAVVIALPLVLVPVYALVPPPASTLMLVQMGQGVKLTRDWVPMDEMGTRLPTSVLMSEDGRFCAHGGVDWDAVQTVIEEASDGGGLRGASTITMQVVKNLFLWPSRSFVRKGLEVPLALYADLIWSKRRTMELYLNIAEWGPGIFGAGAAADHYFGRSPADLTARQAAQMTSALPNPFVRNARNPGPRTRRLASIIETRAAKAGPYDDCLYPG
ncbi:MAG: monofunctional biosynthetic peptidoglycan transglycosylase [Pseudomonadota bacterium]